SILNASGYRTGLYTSPHLVDLRERWMIAGAMIEPELLQQSIEALRDAAARANIEPTYFEALTIVAFIAFARAQCDVVVLEVGMGGRLDATNVVRPVAALITPVGFDHMEFLGDTLRKIAFERAGVIHRGAIVLTSNVEPIVLDVLRRRAGKFGNVFHVVRGDASTQTPLAGDFQRDNIALAARAALELAPQFPNITEETIARGIASTKWRGRLEHLRARGKDIWIDGCHNAHAATAVAPFIEKNIPRPRTLVFGIMSDKDVDDVTRVLYPLFDRIITTEPYPPRSADARLLARPANAIAEPDPRTALERALESDTRSIFVGGSLYLAGAAIEFFDKIAPI
ncbi:MAG TPA: Mur ligase family protein, partial [Thermoanaerobaculia bacterium]|nr:Mur ligase family protein [Thermoanaerobaculia bacterium]